MNVDYFNYIVKIVFINFYAILIFFKINNYKNTKLYQKIYMGILVILSTIMYLLLRTVFDIIVSVIMICIFETIAIKAITKKKTGNVTVGIMISNAVSLILMVISAIIEFVVFQRALLIKADNNISLVINVILIEVVEAMFLFFIFKTRRLKDGFIFLQRQNEYIDIAVINISIVLVLVYTFITYANEMIYKSLFWFYILLGVLTTVIIQKTIVMYYKQKLTNDTIKDYELKIQEKDSEIKRLTEESFRVSKINHEFYNRQRALEKMVNEKLKKADTEFAEDNEILSRIQELTKEHSNKLKENRLIIELPKTDISEIDDMFKYMQDECVQNNIEFNLKVSGNIHHMINALISKEQLETMIGDHIKDAIIAINSIDSSNKKIFTFIGLNEKYYELCISDTGIEFEIETLAKLGIEPATTHKDTGGSGIGFITTFETLKQCNATIEIEEKGPISDTDYTKVVKFIFNGKNEYRIKSYRRNNIQSCIIDKRIKIFSL